MVTGSRLPSRQFSSCRELGLETVPEPHAVRAFELLGDCFQIFRQSLLH